MSHEPALRKIEDDIRENPDWGYRDVRDRVRDAYFTHASIARQAYRQWEAEGRPDGEDAIETPFPQHIKNRDRHWMIAKLQLHALLDIDARTIFSSLNYARSRGDCMPVLLQWDEYLAGVAAGK